MWHPPMALTLEEHKIAARTRKARKFFVFLRAPRQELLEATFQDTLAETYRAEPGGTEPGEAGLLARATLLQAYGHVGDRDAVALTVRDQGWQMGLDGLGAEPPPCSPGTLCHFRMRLLAHHLDQSVRARTGTGAAQTGGFGARQRRAALDSTPLVGAGRVEDPWPLRGQAWRQAVDLAARALGTAAEALLEEAGLVLVGHRSLKAALDLDWGPPKAREQALRWGLAEVDRWHKWGEQPQRLVEAAPPRQDVMDTLTQIVTQDTEPAPDGGPGGKRIKKPVAPDRRSSIAEADRRHGRKSSAKTFNGFQAHCGLDGDRQVTREVVGRPANEPAPAAVELLVEPVEPPPGLLQLDSDLGDRASPRRAQGAAQGVYLIARPWPPGGTRFPKDAFPLACAHGTVTCPGGQTVPMGPGQDAQLPASAWNGCPQRAQGTTARSGPGRSLHIREDDPFQPKLRATSKTQRRRASRRNRTAVAPALSQHIAPQGRRARYKGLRKNQFDGRRHAAVSTLQGAAHYGETRQLAS